MLASLWVAALEFGSVAAAAEPPVPFDSKSGEWLFGPETLVSRNDVLYTTPSPDPWEAMPTGGGDLSAMVRWDGSLHLHLTKSDCWGFQAPPEAPPGTRFFNNVSPGHVRLSFGPGAAAAAQRRFRQRLDLYHGCAVIEIGEGPNSAQVAVWGHPEHRVLVVEVRDPAGLLNPVTVELSEGRDTMAVGAEEGRLWAREVLARPARPHLSNSGMDDFYPPGHDPLQGRGVAVIVASPDAAVEDFSAQQKTATLRLGGELTNYRVMVSAAVTTHGDPVGPARQELRAAEAVAPNRLSAEHQAWWREYWSRSFVRVTSADRAADWLTAAYYVHLYTLGCTNRGPVPAKWDGGAGLMADDQRNWGLSEWVQEIRFTFLPLYAANRLETARGLSDFYSAMAPYLRAQTRRMWDLPGLWIPETVTPWGHAEDWVLDPEGHGGAIEYHAPWDPDAAPYGRFRRYNPYIGFLFTSGLEVCWHSLTYARYSGDETFLREEAYPLLRGVCTFLLGLLREGEDGHYHLDPANALETWWMVRDPSDTLDGLRAILPELIRLSEQYGTDQALRERCREVLNKLPDPPRGLWHEDGSIDPSVDVYAPAAAKGPIPNRVNAENPQLYRVFPFGLSGLGTPDFELARRTFEHRICVLNHGWSMDAIWAARLGLGEEACALLVRHARQFNRFRYGGWDSNDSNVFPGGLAAAPFLDAGGLSAYALNEILLQSHGGIIRVAPAVSKLWSGSFRLRAEAGFLVAADITDGVVRFVEVRSLLGQRCTIANPWPGECLLRKRGQVLLRTDDRAITFPTDRGSTYLLENPGRSLSTRPSAPPPDAANDQPGLPGRDT